MNPAVLIVIVMAGVCAAALAYALIRTAMTRKAAYVWHQSENDWDQWRVTTPAGPAVVTRVFEPDNGGWAFEIETSFRRERTRLHYVAPARRVVDRRLAELVEEHRAGSTRH